MHQPSRHTDPPAHTLASEHDPPGGDVAGSVAEQRYNWSSQGTGNLFFSVFQVSVDSY